MDDGPPVRAGLIGAGKFGSMFLSQVPRMRGLEVPVIGDLDPDRARLACHKVGWDAARIDRTAFVASGDEACGHPDIDVVVEATGSPAAGIAHARAAVAAGKHIVMVNVEADVLAGPLLAAEAQSKGVVYSLGYGDQPALTCELVDWARACGFDVDEAGVAGHADEVIRLGGTNVPHQHLSRHALEQPRGRRVEDGRSGQGLQASGVDEPHRGMATDGTGVGHPIAEVQDTHSLPDRI